MVLIHTAEFDTPVGSMLCATSEKGLAYVRLPRAGGRGFAGWLRRNGRDAEVRQGFAPNRVAIAQILEYLAGKRRKFDLPLDLRGTDFQLRVWNALLEIPFGETRSYAELARSIDEPRAVRAVGTANGANPCSLVVPCHRVVASGGKLGGYGGGLPLKQRLLALERRQPINGDLL
jgi:methylated-DNA-[protein]-cysteine S-methyltransferase